TILAFRYFLETERARWLTASAVAFALAGVTKENAYMTGVLFVAFGFWAFLERVLAGKDRPAAARAAAAATAPWVRRHFAPLVTGGFVCRFLWVLMCSVFGRLPGRRW